MGTKVGAVLIKSSMWLCASRQYQHFRRCRIFFKLPGPRQERLEAKDCFYFIAEVPLYAGLYL